MTPKLTVKQAASRAGVSAGLVYRWADENRLPHFRLGGRGTRGKILIDQADLDAFLEAQKRGGPAVALAPRPAPPVRPKHLSI